MRILVRLLIVSSLAAATSLQAITYIVPNDRDLVKRAEAIVVVTAMESRSEYTMDGRIVTIATLAIDEVLNGEFADQLTIDLTEIGGFVGERGAIFPGSPRYAPGKRYMVFLRRTPDGWATYGFGLGKFEYINDRYGNQVLVRGGLTEGIFGWNEINNTPHIERSRDALTFKTFVETLSASPGAPARDQYFVSQDEAAVQSSLYSPMPTVSVPGGLNGNTAMAAGTGNWSSAGAGVNYTVGASNPNAAGGFSPDGINAVLFNDPCGIVPQGVAALGGFSAISGTYKLPPDTVTTYGSPTEVDVVVGKNFSTNQATFNGLMTHEIGHTLGFRHSDKSADDSGACLSPSPCSTNAIMNSFIAFNLQSLQQWDLDAVQTVYGNHAGTRSDYLFPGNPRWQSPSVSFNYCFGATITTQPSSGSIVSGAQTTLNVGATGTNATYQWYIGNPPNTSTTAANGTTSSLTVSPTVTTTYWVQVRACPSSCIQPVNSNGATVTVTGCTAPSVAAPNAAPSTIASGQSSTLTANPTGTGPFTYQWYLGNSGVTTTPISGATNSSATVSPTTTTSYWVRVTGQCAPASDSPATTVTVAACVPPSAPAPNASPSSIPSGQSSTLSVNPTGTGPFTYQWFVGNSGITTTPIQGATGSFTTVSPTTNTSYWVRVTGQCGSPSDSPAATVTVTCAPIASGPTAQPSTINAGSSSTLFITTNGSGPFTIQWYAGNVGDTSTPIQGATGTSILVSPAASAVYWVHVTASCGSQDGSVIVFVAGSPCIAPSISTQPASSSIGAGSPVTLTVSTAGTAPLTFQWFIGEKGDTSNAIAGATSSSLTRSPTATTKYWVRVSNSCNGTQSVDSNAATVTVTPVCTNPSITTHPASVSAAIGTAATLKVSAAGNGLHYQWFQGAKGDTSKPVGSDSAVFITSAISSTTSFWVRVTGACGNPAESFAATVTAIAAPRGRAAKH